MLFCGKFIIDQVSLGINEIALTRNQSTRKVDSTIKKKKLLYFMV